MFRQQLEENLGLLFNCPINQDLGQARNKCELYYHIASAIDISNSDDGSMSFTFDIMVEKEFDIDMAAYGELTACCHAYDRMADKSFMRSYTKEEIPVNADQTRITVGKIINVTCTIDYDKVRETIKTINWSE